MSKTKCDSERRGDTFDRRPKTTSLESIFQAKLIEQIKRDLPGSIVLKPDQQGRQGYPDLIILYKKRWGSLEVKRSKNAKHQPNQDFYVRKFACMSFCSFIYPENKEEVLDALYRALCAQG